MDKENPVLDGAPLPIKKRKLEELLPDTPVLDGVPLTQPEPKDQPAPSKPRLDVPEEPVEPLTLKESPPLEVPPGFELPSKPPTPIPDSLKEEAPLTPPSSPQAEADSEPFGPASPRGLTEEDDLLPPSQPPPAIEIVIILDDSE
jgi:hypothetical protein